MSVHVWILNYNGRELLAECLPSVLAAAAQSRRPCRVSVIDNSSTDGSAAWLAAHFPQVSVVASPNRGLCSFNAALARSSEPIAILLNNDIKLEPDAIDPWVAPLLSGTSAYQPDCFLTAPCCWLFDGETYEGFRTAVRWRWGLVQATARFEGHESRRLDAGPTASAGAAIAVDRAKFVELGGFEPLYLPGRIEDLDLAYRAYQRGQGAIYVPEAVAYHAGQATFGRSLGEGASHRLALRNTLLFQWKHLRKPQHLLRQAVGLPLRAGFDICRAPWQPQETRFMFCRALVEAVGRRRLIQAASETYSERRELAYFEQFHPRQMGGSAVGAAQGSAEADRWRRHPISRWYLAPVADRLAAVLARSGVRPTHLTLVGLACAAGACAALLAGGPAIAFAALLVWLNWFFDRLDGIVARRQQTESPLGAWFDANTDEIADLALQAATAVAAARLSGSAWPAIWLVLFLLGKYLLVFGIAGEGPASHSDRAPSMKPVRAAWHLPGNADVRVHLLMFALVTGMLTAQLAAIAIYYNVRWIARYARAIGREAFVLRGAP